jgi:hypothetical protein
MEAIMDEAKVRRAIHMAKRMQHYIQQKRKPLYVTRGFTNDPVGMKRREVYGLCLSPEDLVGDSPEVEEQSFAYHEALVTQAWEDYYLSFLLTLPLATEAPSGVWNLLPLRCPPAYSDGFNLAPLPIKMSGGGVPSLFPYHDSARFTDNFWVRPGWLEEGVPAPLSPRDWAAADYVGECRFLTVGPRPNCFRFSLYSKAKLIPERVVRVRYPYSPQTPPNTYQV